MYSYFSGTVLGVENITLSLKVDGIGIGYDIYASPSLIAQSHMGGHIEVWMHHHVTEVSEALFGFVSREERSLFRELNKVNGIGGKTALALLGLGQEALLKAIQFEDDALLCQVPGIGKKTAQKIIVDLKGSITLTKPIVEKRNSGITTNNTLVISSLAQMGYDKARIETILETLDPSLPVEQKTREIIRQIALG